MLIFLYRNYISSQINKQISVMVKQTMETNQHMSCIVHTPLASKIRNKTQNELHCILLWPLILMFTQSLLNIISLFTNIHSEWWQLKFSAHLFIFNWNSVQNYKFYWKSVRQIQTFKFYRAEYISWLQKTTVISYWLKTTWSKIIGVRSIILLPSLCTNSNNKRLQRNFKCRGNTHLWTELFVDDNNIQSACSLLKDDHKK